MTDMIKEIEESMNEALNDNDGRKRRQELEVLKSDIAQMKAIADKHDEEFWSYVITFPGKDDYAYQHTAEKRQINFVGDNALHKQVAIDAFITHYPKEHNYHQ